METKDKPVCDGMLTIALFDSIAVLDWCNMKRNDLPKVIPNFNRNLTVEEILKQRATAYEKAQAILRKAIYDACNSKSTSV